MPGGRYSQASRKPRNTPKKKASIARLSPATAASMASKAEEGDSALQEQNNFEALMQAITTCQTTLTGKIESMQLDISLIRRDMDCFRSRLTEAERKVGEAEDTLQDQAVSLCTLQTKMKVLEARAEDTENRNRRNNLRIVGLPEGAEGKDPTAFTEHLLSTLLPDAKFSDVFVVERAHIMPATGGPPGAPPRTFILKLLNFQDRDLVLREARKIEELRDEGVK